MEIRVDNLKDRPRKLVFEEPAESFPVLCELAEQGAATFPGAVRGELVAVAAGRLIEVEGRLACTVALPCSRCLQPVEQLLDLQVALAFSRQAPAAADADADRELTEEDVGLIAFEGDVLDLRSALEQEVLMGLPQHLLCKDDCAGLCPVCGADLNRGRCNCTPPVFHGGFAALRDFKVSKD